MAETGVTAFGHTTPAMLQTGHGTPEGESEPVLEEEELFMVVTQQERDAWRQMMEQQETTLKDSKEKFSKWYDGITRRRMFAYSRIRKLQEGFRKRSNFYGEIADLMTAMDAKLKAKNDETKVNVEQNGPGVNGESPASDTTSQNREQTTEQNQEQTQEQKPSQQQQPQRQQQEQQQVPQENVVREQTVTVKPLLAQTT